MTKKDTFKKIAILSLLWVSMWVFAQHAFASDSIDSLLNDTNVNVDKQNTADSWITTQNTTTGDNSTWGNTTTDNTQNSNDDAIPTDDTAPATDDTSTQNNNWGQVNVNAISNEINPSIELSNDFKTMTVSFKIPSDLYNNKNIKIQAWLDLIDINNWNKIITLSDLQSQYPDIYNVVKNLKIKSVEAITDDWTSVDNITYSTEENPDSVVTTPEWLPYYWTKININDTSKYYWKNINIIVTVVNKDNWQETLLPPEISQSYIQTVSSDSQNQKWLLYLTTIDGTNWGQIIPAVVQTQQTTDQWPQQQPQTQPQPQPQPQPQQTHVKAPTTGVNDYLPFAIMLIIFAFVWSAVYNKNK